MSEESRFFKRAAVAFGRLGEAAVKLREAGAEAIDRALGEMHLCLKAVRKLAGKAPKDEEGLEWKRRCAASDLQEAKTNAEHAEKRFQAKLCADKREQAASWQKFLLRASSSGAKVAHKITQLKHRFPGDLASADGPLAGAQVVKVMLDM